MCNVEVFVLTVMFGVYHGLVLLPVLLSLLGPDTQQEPGQAEEVGQQDKEQQSS